VSIDVFWRLPLRGDGRSIGAERWTRGDYSPDRKQPHPFARTGAQRDGYTYYDLLLQIGRAAMLVGFDGLWIPESAAGEEPLIVAGSLAREVTRLSLVPSLRAALLSAVYATKIAVSFQRLSGGRLAWNLVTDEADEERPWHGRRWSSDEQIARTGEFLDVAKGFWQGPPFTYQGKYYGVVDGGFAPALQGETLPRIYLSGTSDAALALSARHADVHFFPLAPVDEVRAQIVGLEALARAQGRTLRYGLELDVLAHHTPEEAWAEAQREWEQAQNKTVPISREVEIKAHTPFDALITGEHLWAGFGSLRPGPRTGLVGSFAQIETLIGEYQDAGVSTFVLGAYPHLEGAYRIGEHLLPGLRRHAERGTPASGEPPVRNTA
jgi:alkanesulfonate monooxygenase